MIVVDLPGRILCDEPECGAKSPVQMALRADGGFTFRPPHNEVWQVGASSNGVFVAYCQKHVKEQPRVVAAPAIPSLVRSTH